MAEGLPGTHRVTLGADKGYDAHEFIAELRHMDITPHIAQNDTNRRGAMDERTTRHAGYQVSQKKRKRIEEVFGWMKYIGLLRKLRHRGLDVHVYGGGLQQPEAWLLWSNPIHDAVWVAAGWRNTRTMPSDCRKIRLSRR